GSLDDGPQNKNLALDPAGRIFLSGITTSPDFPTTSGAYQTTLRGGADGFFAVLASDGSELQYSTLIGGPGTDGLAGMAIYQGQFAYMTGYAATGFPTTTGAYGSTN